MSTEVTQAQSNAPATAPSKGTLRSWLESDTFHDAVRNVLPEHLTPERFCRVAISALTRVPNLAKCDQATFFQCMMDLSQMGLTPDGRLAHLIPYRNNKRGVMECQLIVDYKGLVDLAMRSGEVANIHADVVCENDEFECSKGEVTTHKINYRMARGDMFAAYAICTFKNGTQRTEVMSRDEIESVRKRSRAGNSGPWVTDFNEMAKKTVFRRLSKWLPLSPEYRDALVHDADALDPIDVHATASKSMPQTLDEFTDMLQAPDDAGPVEAEA
jgi:recombination protein RecT